MNTDPIASAFDKSLEQILTGHSSLESALESYPQYADELRPMLEAAIAAQMVGEDIEVPIASQASSRTKFLNQAHILAQPKSGLFSSVHLRLGFATLLALLFLVFGSISTIAVSAQALPGDTLYPIKLLGEKTQLLFTQDPNQRLELEKNFDQERAKEINELIQRSRSQTVNFAGELTAVGKNEWLVNGIRVIIAPGTEIVDELVEGLYVGIEGILQDDGVLLVRKVWARDTRIEGLIEAINGDQWTVDGVQVYITPETNIQGLPVVGSRVLIYASTASDGQLTALILQVVEVDLQVTDTIQPLSTDTREPKPTNTVKPSKTAEPTDDDADENEGATDTPKPKGDDDDGEDASKTPKPTDDDDDDDGTDTPKPTHDDDDGTDEPNPTDDDETDTPEPTDDDDDGYLTVTPTPSDDD
jgi:hypothetical protein